MVLLIGTSEVRLMWSPSKRLSRPARPARRDVQAAALECGLAAYCNVIRWDWYLDGLAAYCSVIRWDWYLDRLAAYCNVIRWDWYVALEV